LQVLGIGEKNNFLELAILNPNAMKHRGRGKARKIREILFLGAGIFSLLKVKSAEKILFLRAGIFLS